ncbi:MAG: hypothetical protein PHT13_00905 [Methanosarcina sp.]|nr:hypothetical protein [Methanosarcina sp.]
MNKKYTDKLLLSELVRFHDTFGRMPIHRDLNSAIGMPSGSTFVKRFGTLDNAREQAFRRC